MWYNFLYEHYIMYDSSWNASESLTTGIPRFSADEKRWKNRGKLPFQSLFFHCAKSLLVGFLFVAFTCLFARRRSPASNFLLFFVHRNPGNAREGGTHEAPGLVFVCPIMSLRTASRRFPDTVPQRPFSRGKISCLKRPFS